MTDHTYILLGLGGSHAHGLATETSDLDYRGAFSWPTEEYFRLHDPVQTITTTSDEFDVSAHELRKFLHLASKGNPDVLETFSLSEYKYIEPNWGDRLLELKPAVLSGRNIRAAYMGYANQQFHALKKRADEGVYSFAAGMERRSWKHAKHMFRLLETGYRTISTGVFSTKVDERDWYLETLPNMELREMIEVFEHSFALFKDVKSVIPENPDLGKIEQYLIDYRKAH
jgi:predicted nucleotidyltransferase